MIAPAVLYRRSLFYWVREVYRQLHPNAPPLQDSWYLRAMCFALEQTYAKQCTRLVINIPPRYLKSITTAVAFSSWLLGQDPTLKILVGTYNEDLARLHDRQVRQIMESPQYRATFPGTVLNKRRSRQLELHTTAGGFRMAVTTGGTATGFGGDFIILDDCMKAQDASSEAERLKVENWYRGTIGTRLDNKNEGVIVSIQQRLHEYDLSAVLIEAGAKHLNLPAIAQHREDIPIGPDAYHLQQPGDILDPAREDLETLNRMRREMGARNFSTQYLQDPIPPEGNIVRLEWFPRYDEAPPRERFFKLFQSWDTASSIEPNSAYSVCTTWGLFEGRWYLLHVLRDRLEYPDLKRAVIRMWRLWKPDQVLVENASTGCSLAAEFRAEGPFRVIPWDVSGSKEDRLIGQTGQLEAGKVVLPHEAPWLNDFCREITAAPNCRYWDQVDSMTQFLDYALSRKGYIDTEYDPESGRRLRINRPSSPRR